VREVLQDPDLSAKDREYFETWLAEWQDVKLDQPEEEHPVAAALGRIAGYGCRVLIAPAIVAVVVALIT
jgi:hypothetical protein